MLLVPARRSTADPLAETALARARRTFGETVQSWRFAVWGLLCEAVIAGGTTYWANGETHSAAALAATAVGAILLAGAVAFGSAFVAIWVSAPVRQRDEAREAAATATAAFEARASAEELAAAALMLRTELRDIQRKVANVEATVAGHTYAHGFHFPGEQWARYGPLLASDPALYAVVERAYSKAHRANESIDLRRTRSSGQIGRQDEEDLPGVHRLAGEAIAALSEVIGDSPQDALRLSIIAEVEKSRESLHRTFDNWQEWLTLEAPELESWLRGPNSMRSPVVASR